VTTKEKLLALLEDSKGTFFSGEEIARTLQVSRAAVWKAVNALREDGYTIDAATNKGYRLSPDSDILSPQGIRRFLKPEYRDLDLTVLPTAPSTNALVREKANQGRPEGCVIVACEQTAGRGRYGRQFFSPVDSGVYLSLLLRPTAYSPQQATCLTAAAAAAMCQAIEAVTGQQPGIKWVNDIFLHGKKVCGILTEAAVGLETGTLNYMVLGAGVNLYPPVKGFPEEIQPIAGSVLERSCPEAKNRLVGKFLNRFWDFYAHPECRTYLEDYRARSLAIGRNVTVLSAGKAVSAYAYGIDDDFRLLVRYENGDTEALSYGEIRIQLAESAP
jgi:BirA family biotin operon repressor/biotin-[acetyl-CoA-carboxylase] ligase